MISDKVKELMVNSSVIRALFEEGKNMAAVHGWDNICDFSLGNPNIAPPEAFKDAVIDILENEEPTLVHGYMSNVGYEDVRGTIAASLNKRFGTDFGSENIVMSVGAAGGLVSTLKTFINPGDEVVVFAPFFGEYRSYVSHFDGKMVIVPPNPPSFMPNLEAFEALITQKTKIVIVNTPNNPTGVVYGEDTIKALAAIMEKKQKEFGTDIVLLADEPYRELVYDDIDVPYLTKYYANTIIGYSFSKSLSLPGERIGYLVIPGEIKNFEEVAFGIGVSTRTLGYVNAPSLMQRAVAKCLDAKSDIAFYKNNRDLLYNGVTALGFEAVKPEGAFYLWMKSPLKNEKEFVEMAKKYQLILVPGSGFGGPGYVRLAYCTSPQVIERSLPKFKALMEELKTLPNINL